MDRDPSDPEGIDELSIEERIFGIEVPSNTSPEEHFANIPRVFEAPQGLPQGLTPTDFLNMTTHETRARDGDIEPIATALEGILRMGDHAETRPPRTVVVRRGGGGGGAGGRPI